MNEPTEWVADSSEARNVCVEFCVLKVADTDNFGSMEKGREIIFMPFGVMV